jgi:hypothetical protein
MPTLKSYTLPSHTSRPTSQNLAKSVSVRTHGRVKRCSKLIEKMTGNNEHQHPTTCIKHLAVSVLSSDTARIKSSCNWTGKCFEIGN